VCSRTSRASGPRGDEGPAVLRRLGRCRRHGFGARDVHQEIRRALDDVARVCQCVSRASPRPLRRSSIEEDARTAAIARRDGRHRRSCGVAALLAAFETPAGHAGSASSQWRVLASRGVRECVAHRQAGTTTTWAVRRASGRPSRTSRAGTLMRLCRRAAGDGRSRSSALRPDGSPSCQPADAARSLRLARVSPARHGILCSAMTYAIGR
jgi:hypothetical protein